MSRKQILSILLFIFCSTNVMAQADFYYYNGNKIPITLNENKVCISIPKECDNISQKIQRKANILSTVADGAFDIFVIAKSDYEILRAQDSWQEDSKSVIITPSCFLNENTEAVVTPYLNVELKKEQDLDMLNSFVLDNNLKIKGHTPNLPLWYILSVTPESEKNPLEYANLLFESGNYVASVPDFVTFQSWISVNGPVGKVELGTVSDQLIVKKKASVSKDRIAVAISNSIPQAQISWITDDVCSVIADNQSIEDGRNTVMSNDDIVSVRYAYIRRTYADLMALYPVEKVALYGFDDEISVVIDENKVSEAEQLITSLGFETKQADVNNVLQRFIYVSKESDIVAIANWLYESGCFKVARPSSYIVLKDMGTVSFDKSTLPFYHGSDGNKVYLYKTPGRFTVKKGNDTDKSVIETIIDGYLSQPSYRWITDNLCIVETEDQLVDAAIANIRNEASVISANRNYLIPAEYERTLKEGTDYPADYCFDERIILKLKSGVSESVKDSLRNARSLTVVNENSAYYTWAAGKTDDILAHCAGLYDSGLVEWAEPNWVTGFKIIWHGQTDTTTGIDQHITVQETGISYYDLTGRKMESPKGFTIVVTNYSDGSTKVKKVLY